MSSHGWDDFERRILKNSETVKEFMTTASATYKKVQQGKGIKRGCVVSKKSGRCVRRSKDTDEDSPLCEFNDKSSRCKKRSVKKSKTSVKKSAKKKSKKTGCVDMSHLKKYRERNSPSYPANQCCGMTIDGYISVRNKAGICQWRKIPANKKAKKAIKNNLSERRISLSEHRARVKRLGEKAGPYQHDPVILKRYETIRQSPTFVYMSPADIANYVYDV
tara:strand:+ start:419 stop:1075 length:657 start_codon:yes stop_codon:yes gene_type:complete